VWATPKVDGELYGLDLRVRITSVDGGTHTFFAYPDGCVSLAQKRHLEEGGEVGGGGEGIGDEAPLRAVATPAQPVINNRTVPKEPSLSPIGRGMVMELFITVRAVEPQPHHIEVARVFLSVPKTGEPAIRYEPFK
jgi:hypothetical protein